jgi:hypothetical protein
MYSVYQHWDPLKVCIVGRSYAPEFYSFIKNAGVRSVMERIAAETEEDYQKLIKLLESFGVDVLRPRLVNDHTAYLTPGSTAKILQPPMTPRDYSIMLGTNFFINTFYGGDDNITCIPESLMDPLENLDDVYRLTWGDIVKKIAKTNKVYIKVPENFAYFGGAFNTRVGRDVYTGTHHLKENLDNRLRSMRSNFPEYRWHGVDTNGHNDGVFCPVKPGLIISLLDIPTYAESFPGWEVVYLPEQSWEKVRPFLKLKQKNYGKWWVPGEELNDEFTEFVESWLGHWMGYVEETVFDVNMLVIDEHNVVCNNYNKQVFDAFERHGITPHVINFRHRYFWDGGLHCITSDIHREGVMKDYFPERG